MIIRVLLQAYQHLHIPRLLLVVTQQAVVAATLTLGYSAARKARFTPHKTTQEHLDLAWWPAALRRALLPAPKEW